MKRFLCLFIILTLIGFGDWPVSAAAEAQVNSMSVNAAADANIYSSRPDSNFGQVLNNTVVPKEKYSLIKFNSGIVESADDVISVRLKMQKTMARYFNYNSIGVDFYNGNYTDDRDMLVPVTYSPLLVQAYFTGNAAYINKWCDYMDGLYFSIYDVNSKYPLDSGMSGTGLFLGSDVMILINELMRAVNVGFSYNNGASYIRFLLLLYNYYIPDVIVKTVVHPQNWNLATQSIMLRWSEIFKDFAGADRWQRLRYRVEKRILRKEIIQTEWKARDRIITTLFLLMNFKPI